MIIDYGLVIKKAGDPCLRLAGAGRTQKKGYPLPPNYKIRGKLRHAGTGRVAERYQVRL